MSVKMPDATVFDCGVVELGRIENRAGNMTVLEPGANCPFPIPRIYYLYDVPGGASRGGHAHYELQQFVIAASGSFDVIVDDAVGRRTVSLNRPNYALHIVPGIWRELSNFSSGAVCLVMASHPFAESDYIRDYDVFRSAKK